MIVIPWILILIGNIIVACFHPARIVVILMFSVLEPLTFVTNFTGVFQRKLPNYYLKMILNLLFLFSIALGVIFYCSSSVSRSELFLKWIFSKIGIIYGLSLSMFIHEIIFILDASKHCTKSRSEAIVVFRNV